MSTPVITQPYVSHRLQRMLSGILLAGLFAAGCATGPRIFSNQDPAADFSRYRTFGFMEELGTDRAGYSSLLSEYLRTATARELEARGYARSDDPDLRVNFNVATRERIQTTSAPAGPVFGGYYGFRSPYYGVWSGYETRTTQFTEGTLTIDVVDARRDQLVWEGTATGRVRAEHRENLQPVIDRVTAQIFQQWPPGASPAGAAGTPPAQPPVGPRAQP